MKCTEPGCDGETNFFKSVTLMTGGRTFGVRTWSKAYPCNKCGRLYWGDGSPVNNKAGKKKFLLNGKVVRRAQKKQVPIKTP